MERPARDERRIPPAWLLLALALVAAACAGAPPPAVARDVDLERYLGTWYEIASYPTWFQRGCVATQADYAPLPGEPGALRVENQCRKERFDGALERIEGRARVVDAADPAKLEVQFFWPFWGDYWILAVDPGYRWALVGHPSRDFLWILSRTRTLDEASYGEIVARAAAEGFDPARLVRTPQPGAAAP